MFRNVMQNLSTKQKLVLLVCFVVFVLLVIVGLINVFSLRSKDEVVISNLENYASAAPRAYKEDLQSTLWFVLNKRFNLSEGKVSEYDVVIREGSYKESVGDDTTVAKFLVDVDALRQTFAVTFSWPSRGSRVNIMERAVINCPKREEMKYPDSFCDGQYNNSTDLDLYLPYTKYDANSNPLYQITYYDGWIMVSLQTCGDEKLTAQYRAEVDAWLKDTKIDLEKYKDKTRYKTTCDHNF